MNENEQKPDITNEKAEVNEKNAKTINEESKGDASKKGKKVPLKEILIIVVSLLIIAGLSFFIYNKVNDKTELVGKIELRNENQNGAPVIGQKYSLKNSKGKSLGEVETGNDGKITFYMVPEGDYYLESVQEVEGYKPRVQQKEVTVYPGEKTIVSFVNDWQHGSLKVKIVDDANAAIENAIIYVYDAEGYVYDTLVTDKEGMAYVDFKENGEYYLRDNTETDTHTIDDTLYKLKVDDENKNFETTLTQERHKGTILLVITDENKAPLEGIEYEVLTEAKEHVTTLKTNAKGLAGVKNLALGTYYIHRVNSTTDTEMIECKIETNGQIIRKDISTTK